MSALGGMVDSDVAEALPSGSGARFWRLSALFHPIAILLFGAFGLVAAEPKRVLIVHSFGNAAPPFTTASTAFEAALVQQMGEHVDLDEVFLDVARYTTLDMEGAVVELMRKRQARWQPDLVVPFGSPASIFVAQYRDRLFPATTPIIYTGMDQRRLPSGALQQNATFIGTSYDLPGAVEDILQVAPATTNIVIVIGATPLEQFWVEVLRQEYQKFTNRVQFTWFNNLSFDQMLEQAARLPPRSFMLLILLMGDATGVTHNADEALRRIHKVANAPINGLFNNQMGMGIVGGRLYADEQEGMESARVAVRILRGEPATNFPARIVGPLGSRYDWRELQRWNISKNRLPPGSVVMFREPTIWARYRGWIISGVSAVVAEGLIITLLLANLIKRRRAERSLAESEARFRIAADAAPVMVWMSGVDKLCTFFNKGWLDFTGRTLQQELGNGWMEGVHPEDCARCLESYAAAFDARSVFTMEYRLRRQDGAFRWILDKGTPRFAPDRTFLGFVGCCVDLTDRRQAEADLRASQERMDLAAEAAQLGMWVWNISANTLWLSEKCRELFAFPKNGDLSYEAILQRVHPDDRHAVEEATRAAIARKAPYRTDYRLLLPDQRGRWITASGRVDFDSTGKPLRLLGICIDVSEQRRTEEAARELSGRLIHAQEDERRRIARDLHDDLNQQLALISVEMELFGRERGDSDHRNEHMERVVARVKGLSAEVHKLSYQLHPAKLDQLGLVAAARSFCRDLSQQSGIKIDFGPENMPRDVPAETALCLYRVLQESLQNMVRHSEAREAQVKLRGMGDHLHLSIIDYGKGFDLEVARRTGGLGLISMEERVRLVRGSFRIHSQPGTGTQIDLTVPLPKKHLEQSPR